MSRAISRTCLALLLAAMAGLVPAWGQELAGDVPEWGQEDDYLVGDVPEWLEGYGYEDTHDDVPVPEVASERREGDSGGTAPRTGTRSTRQCDCLRCRNRLTGDWCGYRSCLQQGGIAYRGRVTQFFFGVGGGVNPPVPDQLAALGIAGGDQFEYTGNSRHDFLVDLDKFGGLPHSKFLVTLENIWGRWGNVSFETGALQPPVFSAVMPVDPEAEGIPRLTNFVLLQPLSEQFIVTVGKTRLPGVADNNIFAGGDGTDQFLNQALIANPLFVPVLPITTFVVGAVMPQEWGHIGLTVLDARDRSTDYFQFGDLFAEGAMVFGQVQVDTNFFNRPGEHHVGGLYKNVDQQDLSFTPLPPPYPVPPDDPGPPQFLTRPESYVIFYGFDQYVITFGPPNARGKTEGWGVFGRAGIADDATGNPNFSAWTVSGGIGGNSALRSRRGKGDRFGLGYSYIGASTEFGPIPQFLFGPRDAQVLELYYRYKLTPAIELTPDVQWVSGLLGGLTDGDDAIVAGFRLNMQL